MCWLSGHEYASYQRSSEEHILFSETVFPLMLVRLARNDPWEVVTSTLEKLHQIARAVVSKRRLNVGGLHLLLSQ